jgi:hypothetical protein
LKFVTKLFFNDNAIKVVRDEWTADKRREDATTMTTLRMLRMERFSNEAHKRFANWRHEPMTTLD